MEYYINPLWFWLMDIIDGLTIACATFGSVVLFGSCAAFIIGRTEISFDNDDEEKKFFSIVKKCFKFSIIAIIMTIILPSKATCIEMMTASIITKPNVEYAKGEVKELVDYIFDKTKEVENDE